MDQLSVQRVLPLAAALVAPRPTPTAANDQLVRLPTTADQEFMLLGASLLERVGADLVYTKYDLAVVLT